MKIYIFFFFNIANHRISNTISKYSDNCSTMTSEISGKDLLGISVDQTELNNEKRSYVLHSTYFSDLLLINFETVSWH